MTHHEKGPLPHASAFVYNYTASDKNYTTITPRFYTIILYGTVFLINYIFHIFGQHTADVDEVDSARVMPKRQL